MTAAFIFLLIFLGVMFAVRYLSRRPDLLARAFMWFLARRQRKARERSEREAGRRTAASDRTRRASRGPRRAGREPIIPREYAQDVEYVEVKGVQRVVETMHIRVESQMSDAEWEDIPPEKK